MSLAQPVQPFLPFSVLVTQWTRILGEIQRMAQIPRHGFRGLPSSAGLVFVEWSLNYAIS
ncbi:MAG TPA: hypothetical protein P5149_06100 [Candidatus Competibacteraceae bacterium]|nr:hypothetical protein [Gammaproteobacteria bacterium]HRY17964.1 hypothetical protein [Candidatus Competibacteraceae bacterium]